jgi:hypothetical protein
MLAIIPTEVVAAYTSVLGVLSAVVGSNAENEYVPLRWALWGASAIAVVLAVAVAYYTSAERGSRSFPVGTSVGGVVAFLAWGIVVPGSALYFVLDDPLLPVMVGVISAAGVFLVKSVIQPLLARPRSPQPQNT